jgi:hypothetical protein
MAIQRVDEVLDKALSTDSAVVPRYDVVLPNGTKVAENAELVLKNPVLTEGMPINKQAMDECLAASGVTAGTATAFTLAQPGFVLADGALIRFRLHVDSGATPTINVNGTGAKKLMQNKTKNMKAGIAAGTWLTAIYSSTFGFFVLQGSMGSLGYDYRGTKAHSKLFEQVVGWDKVAYDISWFRRTS